MDCNKIEEQYLIAYLFEEADGEERRIVEEHLESCSKCTKTLAELRETVTTMHRWKDEDIPHRVVLMPGSSAPERRRFAVPLWLRGMGWAAAAAILVLVLSQGSVHYGDGALTVSFGRGEDSAPPARGPEIAERLEGGQSTMAPTQGTLPTSDTSSSTPLRTGPLSPTQPGIAYASMQDLEAARAQNLAYFQEMMKISDEQRAEQWRQTVGYFLGAVEDQRQRDMNELMLRIDAIGAGTLSEIDMTNRRLDQLAQNVMAEGWQPAQQTRQTPGQAGQRLEDDN